jgi:hypothetical protein
MAALSMRELQIFFDRIRSNKVFELFVVAVILFSAVMIGVNSYALDDRVMQVLLVLDVAITVFFLFELSIRFLGEPEKRAFFRQGWNVFDTLIVTVSLIPIDEAELALLGTLDQNLSGVAHGVYCSGAAGSGEFIAARAAAIGLCMPADVHHFLYLCRYRHQHIRVG